MEASQTTISNAEICRAVEIHLDANRPFHAMMTLAFYLRQNQNIPGAVEAIEPIAALEPFGLPESVIDDLEGNGFETVGQLLDAYDTDRQLLCEADRIGYRSLSMIEDAIKRARARNPLL